MTLRRALIVVSTIFLSACGQDDRSEPTAFTITQDRIDAPLTAIAGSVARGEIIFVERERGHCVLCHKVNALSAPFQGNVGPDLSAVGARLNAAQIRLRIVDASQINADTVMPPYYRTTGLTQVPHDLQDQPVLKAEEIEDLVAYLVSLKG